MNRTKTTGVLTIGGKSIPFRFADDHEPPVRPTDALDAKAFYPVPKRVKIARRKGTPQ